MKKIPRMLAAALFQEALDQILTGRDELDTAEKALKSVGLFVIISRLKASNQIITRRLLSKYTGLTENALTSQLAYLERVGVIEIRIAEGARDVLREYLVDIDDYLGEHVRVARESLKRTKTVSPTANKCETEPNVTPALNSNNRIIKKETFWF